MADTQHFGYFKVKNFRRFDELEVKDIGQFNLIVGDNNVGKTSLLEALLLDENPNQTLMNFLTVTAERFAFNPEVFLQKDQPHILGLLQRNAAESQAIIHYEYIYCASPDKPNDLEIRSTPFNDFKQTYLTGRDEYLNLRDNIRFLVWFWFNMKLGKPGKKHENGASTPADEALLSQIPGQNFMSFNIDVPYVGLGRYYQDSCVRHYSDLVQKSRAAKNQLIAELRNFIPKLENIEIITTLIEGKNIMVAQVEDRDHLVPLASFGDGAGKQLRCSLEMLVHAGKRLMIDEIDAGIHYSRMRDFWRMVLQSAENNNVQIFATTHNKECLQAYKEVLEEAKMQYLQERARCIKLSEVSDGDVKAFTYGFEDFQHALDHDNELRGVRV